MTQMFIQGNEAVGWGALNSDCDGYFGYPITPQNEVIQWFATEFPKRGKVFVQAQAEVASINMVYGGASAGYRVMTSTSSPGWGLMQETISHCAAAELPCVIALIQRGGPGAGSIRHSQMDYVTATKGGGQGGYKNIVLAPSTGQEIHDLMQLAFHLADKYRNPLILLMDGIMGQVSESIEIKKLKFEPLEEKKWALRGSDFQKDGKSRAINSAPGVLPLPPHANYIAWIKKTLEKYKPIEKTEIRYQVYKGEDADLFIVAYGYTARVSKEAIDIAREMGLKVGMIRPITLWPFPKQIMREKSDKGCKFLVVEDSQGLLIEDVKIAVGENAQVGLISMLDRHIPTDGGMIMPGRVLGEIKKILS